MSSGQNVGNVFLTLKATGMSAFQKQVKNEGNKAAGVMTKTFSSAFSKIGAITAAALSTRAIKSFVKESIDIASDLAEVQNVVDVTFGNSAKIINDFAESAPKAYGLSTLAAKQYSGTIGAMLKSMRIAQKDVLGMSTSIASLAGDMASFYNLDTDTAFEKIRAGISGETEPLKQLGINLSVANLEQYRMNKGITTAYNKMSQADQAILRYNYLLEVTADAQGDFARTSDSWANQTRILALNIDTLKASVGNLAIQALTPLIIKLNQIIEYAIAAAQALTQLFGGKVDTSSAGAGMSAVSASAVQAAGDMTDTAKTAKKTAKAIKASFADFDEIHLLGNPKDDSSAGADTAGAAGGQALSPLSVTNKTNTQSLDNNFDKKKLSNIGKLSGLALVGMGVIFILTGHLPLGLAMVAAGTSISAASINWGTLEHNISSIISIISAVVGGAMLAVGAVLCFSGAYMPLGIGLMASGAASLGSAAALNWSGLSDQMRDRISVISAIVGGSLLALGAILCFSSVNIPLGIEFNKAVNAGMGLHTTTYNGVDYYHDSETLGASSYVVKASGAGIAWTDDGIELDESGEDITTWKYGFSKNGTAILGNLQAYRVNADLIICNDLSAINATIAGWNMTENQLYSDYGRYRAFIQNAQAAGADSWIFSTQYKNSSGTYEPRFMATARGEVYAYNKIETDTRYYSNNTCNNYHTGLWHSYKDTSNNTVVAKFGVDELANEFGTAVSLYLSDNPSGSDGNYFVKLGIAQADYASDTVVLRTVTSTGNPSYIAIGTNAVYFQKSYGTYDSNISNMLNLYCRDVYFSNQSLSLVALYNTVNTTVKNWINTIISVVNNNADSIINGSRSASKITGSWN